MTKDRIPLPGLEKRILRLADWIACHELRAVRGQPGGVVARRAPAARIERGATVRDPEKGDVTVPRRGQRVEIGVSRAEQQSHPRFLLLYVVPQRFHHRSADHAPLAPASD